MPRPCMFARLAVLSLTTALASGCGLTIGSVLDMTEEIVFYPSRAWLFAGIFKYDNSWGETFEQLPTRTETGDINLAVCISGGGSRSAYFAACVLDALGKTDVPGTSRSYLEEIDIISSVSGGSLAAAYYCANRHRDGYPANHDAFFQRMRDDLALDFEMRALGRILAGYWLPLRLTFYDRGNLLGTVWDSNLFDGMTFGDLEPEGPVLLINATCLDNGEKFVFTRAAIGSGPSPLARLFPASSVRGSGWRGSYRAGTTMTLETIGSNVGACPLSTAVIASAAVPGLLGPRTYRNLLLDHDLHLGDGGIYDNHGSETAIQALAPLLEARPNLPAILLVFDAAGFFESGEAAGDVVTVGGYSERMVTISWLRVSVLGEVAFRLAQAEALRLGHPLAQMRYETISLYDDRASADVSDDPDLIARVMSQVRLIGTRFSLDEDEARAIESVAPRVVKAALRRLERTTDASTAPEVGP